MKRPFLTGIILACFSSWAVAGGGGVSGGGGGVTSGSAASFSSVTTTGQFIAPMDNSGPFYSFLGATDTGIGARNPFSTHHDIFFWSDGTQVVSFSAVNDAADFSIKILAMHGNAATPGIIMDYTGTGFYSEAAGNIGMTLSGSAIGKWTIGQGLRIGDGSDATAPLDVVGLAKISGGIAGTTTNDNATAGNYGQYISSVTAAASVATSGQFGNQGQVSLTAGDWDVTGTCDVNANGGTVTVLQVAISTFSANTTTDHVLGSNVLNAMIPTAVTDSGPMVPSVRMTMVGTTTTYLKIKATYTVATPTAACRISARRPR